MRQFIGDPSSPFKHVECPPDCHDKRCGQFLAQLLDFSDTDLDRNAFRPSLGTAVRRT